MWGGQMREMRRNFRIEWIRDTINRKWTRMFVPSDCIIKSSLNNLEQAVMPHQGIKLQPFHRPLMGHMCSPRVLIGRCFGPVHDSSDEVFMIISSMTMPEKLGKNFSSHPRARAESFQWIPSSHWLLFAEKGFNGQKFSQLRVSDRSTLTTSQHLKSPLTVNEKFSMFCRPWCQNIRSKTLKKYSQCRDMKRETGNWRNESLLMTRGSGSGWLISPDLHTLTLATRISIPGSKSRDDPD